MKVERWIWVSLFAAVLVDCRGQYIGVGACGESADTSQGGASGSNLAAAGAGSGGKGSGAAGATCPVCDCEQPGSAGVSSGAGASAGGESGAAGSGSVACERAKLLPVPDVSIGFDDCAGEIKAVLSPHYLPDTELVGTTSGGDLCGNAYDGVGKAAYFDGATQQIRFEHHAAFDLHSDATISVHVKLFSSDVEGAGAFGHWYLYDQFGLSALNGTWRFDAVHPAVGNEFGEGQFVEMMATNDQWVHLVMVSECGKSLTLYANGVLVDEVVLARDFVFLGTGVPFVVGRLHDNSWAQYFHGAVDELRIWHSAFSPAEVEALDCGR